MDMLFSFLEPDRPHSALLAGYFSKVPWNFIVEMDISFSLNFIWSSGLSFGNFLVWIGLGIFMFFPVSYFLTSHYFNAKLFCFQIY